MSTATDTIHAKVNTLRESMIVLSAANSEMLGDNTKTAQQKSYIFSRLLLLVNNCLLQAWHPCALFYKEITGN